MTSERLYRALLVLYPRSFRHDYGDPMVQLFADRRRDVGPKAWLDAVPDLFRTVPSQRIEAVMSRLGTGGRVVALAIAVLGAAAVTVAVVAILVHQRRLFAGSLGGQRAPLRHAVVQAWWAPLAALLGLVMIVAGVGTVFEAHNLGGRIVGSSLLLAFGGAMLWGLMRRPFDRTAGNSLILLATVPAMPFWWLVVPPLVALAVWVGVLSSGFSEPAVA
jgi:hypothetical protein